MVSRCPGPVPLLGHRFDLQVSGPELFRSTPSSAHLVRGWGVCGGPPGPGSFFWVSVFAAPSLSKDASRFLGAWGVCFASKGLRWPESGPHGIALGSAPIQLVVETL